MTSADAQVQVETSLIYQHVTEVPTPNRGWLTHDGSSFQVRFTQNDLITESSRTFIRQWNHSQSGFEDTKTRTELTKVHVYAPHPELDLLAIVRIKDETQGQETFFIEIWNSERLLSIIPTKGKHGYIYNDDHFGELCWSKDGKRIAYTADKNKPKSYSFWSSEKDAELQLKGTQYNLTQDWGEGYTGKVLPRLFILDVESKTINEVEGIDESISVGQMSWSSRSSDRLAFVGWADSVRKSGVRYCINRKSSVYEWREGSSITLLSGEDVVARTPRYSPDDDILVYLSTDQLETHGTCVALKKVSFPSKKVTTLVDVVDVPKGEGSFPGIFTLTTGLTPRCFVSNERLIVCSAKGIHKITYIVDTTAENAEPQELRYISEAGDLKYGLSPLDCLDNGKVLLSFSRLNKVPSILVAEFPQNSTKLSGQEFELKSANESTDLIPHLEVGHKTLGDFPEIFDYLYVLPPAKYNADGKKTPTILFAHGGPHSGVTTEYSSAYIFWALSGYAVVSVNYRGSLGYGKKLVESLPGKCGVQDVQDCLDSLDHFLKRFGDRVDPNNVFYNGGSHGGLIGGFLIGTCHRFAAAVLRNPVTHVPSLYCSTDIPEWSTVEAGATHPSQVNKMWEISPFKHVDDMKTPTLFILGDSDRRVPPSQGLSLHYAMKERGVETSVKMYPKAGHAIVGAEQDADQAVNTILWYRRYARQ